MTFVKMKNENGEMAYVSRSCDFQKRKFDGLCKQSKIGNIPKKSRKF
jgi:hypothetical protein